MATSVTPPISDEYKSIISNIIPNQNHLSHCTEKYLHEIFRDCVVKVGRIGDLSSQLQSRVKGMSEVDRANVEDQSLKITTFVLHYLSMCSTIPILCETETMPRSAWDYIEENRASYYRGDGSSIHKLFLQVVKEHYEGFVVKTNDVIGVIKPCLYAHVMQKACRVFLKDDKYDYKECLDLSDAIPEKRTFFNITPWIEKNLQQDLLNVSGLIKQAQDFVNKLDDQSAVGGVFSINSYVGVYIFFVRNGSESVSELTSELISEMRNLQGNIGAFPEVILMKSALVKIGYLSKVYNANPVSSTKSSDCRNIGEQISAIIDKTEDSDKKPFASIYRGIILKMLQAIKSEERTVWCDRADPFFQSEISQCLTLLGNSLDQLSTSDTFEKQLRHMYLAIEEVIFLSLFFQPKKSPVPIEASLYNVFPKPLVEDSELFCFNSGMSCYDYVLEAGLLALQQGEKGGNKPTLAIVHGSYYELYYDMPRFFANDWDIVKINPKSEETFGNKVQVLLLDLYPNNVTLSEVRVNPVERLIEQALDERSLLTVVLDLSTTLFTDSRILTIKRQFSTQIASGNLTLILIASLAKFYSCGLDRYTGGVVVILGKSANNNLRKELVKNLEIFKRKDPISPEAERFFSLLFSNASDEIQRFYEDVLKHTNANYLQLEHLTGSKESAHSNQVSISRANKDDNIPLIGLQVKFCGDPDEDKVKKITKIMQYYLFGKARESQLPLLIRESFPFPHSAIIECSTALRLVVGLDFPDNKDKYLQLFTAVNNELASIPQDVGEHRDLSDTPEDLHEVQLLLFKGVLDLKKFLFKNMSAV
ncbi:MAG: hypothetical protein K940chlam7_01620 [Chlamydiae bacterium]|nr:hypothetical protein [Chlamydiota bacterium]